MLFLNHSIFALCLLTGYAAALPIPAKGTSEESTRSSAKGDTITYNDNPSFAASTTNTRFKSMGGDSVTPLSQVCTKVHAKITVGADVYNMALKPLGYGQEACAYDVIGGLKVGNDQIPAVVKHYHHKKGVYMLGLADRNTIIQDFLKSKKLKSSTDINTLQSPLSSELEEAIGNQDYTNAFRVHIYDSFHYQAAALNKMGELIGAVGLNDNDPDTSEVWTIMKKHEGKRIDRTTPWIRHFGLQAGSTTQGSWYIPANAAAGRKAACEAFLKDLYEKVATRYIDYVKQYGYAHGDMFPANVLFRDDWDHPDASKPTKPITYIDWGQYTKYSKAERTDQVLNELKEHVMGYYLKDSNLPIRDNHRFQGVCYSDWRAKSQKDQKNAAQKLRPTPWIQTEN